MKNRLTIIIAMYNEIKHIQKCLDSVNNQTKKCQGIVVDNNSTDGSYKFVKNYIKNKLNFDLFICKKKGVSNARNLGWKNCKTEYCFFLDGDEILPSDFVKNLFTLLNRNPDAILFKRKSKGYTFLGRLQEANIIEEEFMRLWSKKAFEKLNGYNPDLKVAEDIDIKIRTEKGNYKIIKSDLIFYHLVPENLKEVISQSTWYGAGLRNSTKNTWLIKTFYILANVFFLTPFIFLILLPFGMNYYLISIAPFAFFSLYKMIKHLLLKKGIFSLLLPFHDILKAVFIVIGFLTNKRFEW